MNLSNDIAPGANYMDRKRCFSIYFYTSNDCFDCVKRKECERQNDIDYTPKKKNVLLPKSDFQRLINIAKDNLESVISEYGRDKYDKENLDFIKKLKEMNL